MKRAKDSKIWGESNHETPGTTRKGRTRKPCLWRFRLFEYFEAFVVTLGRTTKYTKYTKGKGQGSPVFGGFALFVYFESFVVTPLEEPRNTRSTRKGRGKEALSLVVSPF